MKQKTTTVKIPTELQQRVASVARMKSPKTSGNALSVHYIESGVTKDEAAQARQSKEVA